MATQLVEQPGATATVQANGRRRPANDLGWGLLFVLPAAIGFLVFYAWPVARGIYLSFTDYNIFQPAEWIGLDNFAALLTDGIFWNSLVVTIQYVLIHVSTEMVLGLAIAVLMERLTRSVIVRVTLVFPWLVPSVAVAIISLFMLDYTVGIVNFGLRGLEIPAQYFYQEPNSAIWTIALVSTWRNMGYIALLFFAGMQLVPRNLYEAGAIDGAGELRMFTHLTLPLLRPIIAVVLTVSVIGSFQIFDTVAIVYTQPPPAANVLYFYIYQAAFAEGRTGYASAMAVVILALTAALTIVQLRLLRVSQSDLG